MKTATGLCLIACLISPVKAWSQDAPVKIDPAPLLSSLHHKDWMGNRDNTLPDAVQSAFSQAKFETARGPDVLTLSAPDGVKKDKDDFIFTVVFSRDGGKLGEAVESCPITKLSDCTDQLIMDIKTAAQ